jgi:L-methionine (R)-S-oxide reductase
LSSPATGSWTPHSAQSKSLRPRSTSGSTISEGICGAAAASGRSEVVDDVDADPRYLSCFAPTRSEIVVPVVFADAVVGEIDIDSDEPGAFDGQDRAFLEQVAAMIAPAVRASSDSLRAQR